MTRVIEKRTSVHRQLAEQQAQLRSLQEQAAGLEELANLGSAAAMIAHELNNLLTPLINYANMAVANPGDRGLTEKALNKTAANCRQAAKVMEGILAIAVAKGVDKVTTPLLPLVQGVFDCLCRDFSKDGIVVRIEMDSSFRVWAAPVQLQQVMMNLILNARQAMLGRGGVLTISTEQSPDAVTIIVSDTGSGINADDMKNIFEMFFTRRSNGDEGGQSGYGLGLALAKRIIDAHNGSIVVESEPGSGTTFRIVLPKPR